MSGNQNRFGREKLRGYAHNDPNSAEPKVNAFIKRLIPFLKKVSGGKAGKKAEKKKGGKKK